MKIINLILKNLHFIHKISVVLVLTLVLYNCGSSSISSEKKFYTNKNIYSIFMATKSEENQPTIWDVGDTTITNEDRLDLFYPYIQNLGGGYVGVGSSQNFSLAAWADSEWVWLIDFTKIVVRVNRINLAFIKESNTPEEFQSFWESKNEKKVFNILEKYYQNDPEFQEYKKAWKTSAPYQRKRFSLDKKIFQKRGTKLWLQDINYFQKIKKLSEEGRILPLEGDLRGNITMQSIAEQAKKMGISIRILYFSNAEEYFPLDGQFRNNILSLPVDNKSIVLRTISIRKSQFPWAEDSHLSTDRGFHYSIQPTLEFQEWLKNSPPNLRVHQILETCYTDKIGITLCNIQ